MLKNFVRQCWKVRFELENGPVLENARRKCVLDKTRERRTHFWRKDPDELCMKNLGNTSGGRTRTFATLPI